MFLKVIRAEVANDRRVDVSVLFTRASTTALGAATTAHFTPGPWPAATPPIRPMSCDSSCTSSIEGKGMSAVPRCMSVSHTETRIVGGLEKGNPQGSERGKESVFADNLIYL